MVLKTELGVTEGTWENRQPSDLNYLKPNGFKFQIHNLPNVSYFCQSANIPSIGLGDAVAPTPLSDLHMPGDKLQYGELILKFLIQENMSNYIELYQWLVGLGFPNDRSEYIRYNDGQQYRYPYSVKKRRMGVSNFSDADLFILDANNNPCVKFTFFDCFPTSLQSLDFDLQSGSSEYLTGMTSFRYRHYTMELLTTP